MTAARRPALDIRELVGMLAERIDQLCRELLPKGETDGHEYRVGSLAGEPGRSLAVHIGATERRGWWKDFATDEGGDALDLVAAVLFNGDRKRAVAWSRRWLGIDNADPDAIERARRDARAAMARKQAETEKSARDRRGRAFKIWLEARDTIVDTFVDLYLQHRGIDLRELGHVPGVLRFAPELLCKEDGVFYPAMVASINALQPDGSLRFVGCHRTWLTLNEHGKATKADLEEPKKTYGPYKGGFIPLWRGRSNKPIRVAPADDTLVISEGIEDGLSVAAACPWARVIAGVSVSNIGVLRLPPQLTDVIIAAQHEDNDDARKAFARMLEALDRQGRRVRLAYAPPEFDGRKVKDLNDLIREDA